MPDHANFILSKPGNGRSLFLELQKQGIITRALGPLLSDYLRISVGTEEENTRLLTALEKACSVYGAKLGSRSISPTFSFTLFLILWVFFCLVTGLYLGVFRSMIDRIHVFVISTPPGEEKLEIRKIFGLYLLEPNHARPLHVESALLSAAQLFLDSFIYSPLGFPLPSFFSFLLCFALSFFTERLFSGAIPRILASSSKELPCTWLWVIPLPYLRGWLLGLFH